jgi:hypothetical protein
MDPKSQTADLIERLENLRDTDIGTRGDQIKADALYQKILSNLQLAISNRITFDDSGQLSVYALTTEVGLLGATDGELLQYEAAHNRIKYIKTNQVYLEWYFNKQISSPKYKYKIVITTEHENTILNKKTKTTLNIVLHRL